MKVSDLVSRAVPQPLPRSRRIEHIGWVDGYLLVRFWDSDTLYIYGGVEDGTVKKLLRVPFPDALFSNLKKHWKCFKVERKIGGSGPASPDESYSLRR